jgi:hypothetical protein
MFDSDFMTNSTDSQGNPQVHPQLGDNFKKKVILKVEGYFTWEMEM